jgi:polar amino acid transport system permease protein
LAELWSWNRVFEILPGLLDATRVTIAITLCASVVAFALGLALALGRMSGRRIISWPSTALIEFIRSTPLIVQLYFLFYVLPDYGILLDGFTVGVIGLGLHFSAFTAECYRAGIESVSRGQWEAALALNFSKTRTWVSVVLPQAIRVALPSLANYVIGMFKDSAVISVITVSELMNVARADAIDTFQFIEPFTVAGLIYLTLSYVSSIAARRLERRLARVGG